MADPELPRAPAPRLVVFDLDGTITRRDTLFGYVLGFALRRPWRLLGFVRVLPALAGFVLGRTDHGGLKGSLIRHVMGGASRDEIDAWTSEHLPRLLRRGVFPEARAEIAAHRAAGDHLVLMTATVDLYVPQLAAALGFDEHICSEVRWDGDRLDGRLAGANVRDEEKTHRLRRLLPRFPGRPIVGYGNSRPDLAHLRLVDRPVLVNAKPRLRKAAADLPVTFRYWL